jgi:hypothetical protein
MALKMATTLECLACLVSFLAGYAHGDEVFDVTKYAASPDGSAEDNSKVSKYFIRIIHLSHISFNTFYLNNLIHTVLFSNFRPSRMLGMQHANTIDLQPL